MSSFECTTSNFSLSFSGMFTYSFLLFLLVDPFFGINKYKKFGINKNGFCILLFSKFLILEDFIAPIPLISGPFSLRWTFFGVIFNFLFVQITFSSLHFLELIYEIFSYFSNNLFQKTGLPLYCSHYPLQSSDVLFLSFFLLLLFKQSLWMDDFFFGNLHFKARPCFPLSLFIKEKRK